MNKTTIILGGSTKKFADTKCEAAKQFNEKGLKVFNICDEYRKLQSNIAVENAIKNIEQPKLIYIVTSEIPSNWRDYIGTRSIMLIQFGFDNNIPVFLSSKVRDMEDIEEKISGICYPMGLTIY